MLVNELDLKWVCINLLFTLTRCICCLFEHRFL